MDIMWDFLNENYIYFLYLLILIITIINLRYSYRLKQEQRVEERLQRRERHIYNPYGKKWSELTPIYGYHLGTKGGWMTGVLLGADGREWKREFYQTEDEMRLGLGMIKDTRRDIHKLLEQKYKGGYYTEFVQERDVYDHTGLLAAIEKRDKKK